MVGVFEKGKADVRFTAQQHRRSRQRTPTANTPIARLSAFVTHVEKHSAVSQEADPRPQVAAMFTTPCAVCPVRSCGYVIGQPLAVSAR